MNRLVYFGLLIGIFIQCASAGDARSRLDASASFHVNSTSDYTLGKSLPLSGYRIGFNQSLSEDTESVNSFLGGRYRLISSFTGALDISLDTHFRYGNDQNDDGMRIFSPQLTYYSFDRKLYVDLGYAYSRYDENNVTVHQLTPTFGFTFNQRDWFQLRGYLINPNENSENGEQLYTAAEGSWTHRFSSRFFGLSRIRARALLGRRVFMVNQDLKTVRWDGTEQGGSLSLSLHWQLANKWDFMFQNSIEEIYQRDHNNPYRLNYGFFGIERRW